METVNVAVLIEALNLVGQVYRNKNGSQPADAVKKILQQLDDAGEMTLTEWAEARQKKPKAAPQKNAKPKAAAKRKTKLKAETVTPEQALARLERAETQAALRETIATVTLSADQWKALAKSVIGRSADSGKAAREALETHFSNRLLLDERVEGVRRQFS
jgi:hypothetical protein